MTLQCTQHTEEKQESHRNLTVKKQTITELVDKLSKGMHWSELDGWMYGGKGQTRGTIELHVEILTVFQWDIEPGHVCHLLPNTDIFT